MASYPVTVYRSDDLGAPQLVNGTISSFFDVLQKCLVEGYGTKAPLGWTRSFYDPVTFKAAWRNDVANGGSGGSVYFESLTNNDVNQTSIAHSSCKSITTEGVITGRGRSPRIQMGSGSSAWVLIGTAIGFYFYSFATSGSNSFVNLSSTSSSLYRSAFYAGDIFSIIGSDAGKFVTISNLTSSSDNVVNTNSISLGYLNSVPNINFGYISVWDADGADTFAGYGYSAMLTATQDAAGGDASTSPLIYPKLFTPFLLKIPGNLNSSTTVDRDGLPVKISPTRPGIRGSLPGLFCTTFSFGFGQQLPLVITESGVSYHTLPSANTGAASCFVIQTGAWDDPFA
ncbi:MAG: hypothetical protein AB1780_11635 [Pseudomonadota bacterium]